MLARAGRTFFFLHALRLAPFLQTCPIPTSLPFLTQNHRIAANMGPIQNLRTAVSRAGALGGKSRKKPLRREPQRGNFL